jgi:molecular chaperone DnaJ
MVEVPKEIRVRIPRGADSGEMIKVEGEGEPGRHGGVAGDLYIRLSVKDHPIFERKGADLYLKKEIPFTQAILGGKIYGIPGLDGEQALEIPEGTENGSIFKIAGKGMPGFAEERGDLHVEIKICMPKELTCEEKALLADFERLRALRLDPLFLSQHRFGRLALPAGDKDKGRRKRDS